MGQMKVFLNKNKEALGGIVIIVIAFYCGRITSPEKIKTEVRTIEVEKTVNKTERKVIKVKENADGSKDTVIVVDSNVNEESRGKSTVESKEIVNGKRTNVSLLVGGAYPLSGPHYGVSIQRSILGPFTVGAWAITNRTAGLSVGLNF